MGNNSLTTSLLYEQEYEEHGEKPWFGWTNEDNGSCENTRRAVAEGRH